MNKTEIEWCDYTWNPVTGCKRGCEYCYAKRLYERFSNGDPFSNIRFHPERLVSKMPKKPARIFIGSMSDVEYWSRSWIMQIFDVIRNNPIHTFMFLTKNPYTYDRVTEWPQNTMQGLTMELIQTQDCQQNSFLELVKCPRPYLSIEPLMGTLKIEIDKMETVIIGGMTGPGAIKPKAKWIQSIKDNVPEEKIFWKSNIKNMVGASGH